MSVSIKIKGNKRGNDGVGVDLISTGSPFPVIDQQYSGTGSVSDFIIIRHLPDKSVYTIMTKNVTPCDSQRQGTLIISVAVPTGEHVSGLFNMLLELSGFYKSNYMTYDGKLYHFTSRLEQAEGFEAIASKYKIAAYPFQPVKMNADSNAIAYLYMTPAQIAELLEDPMREEFSRFGQVVLVPVADPASQPSTISVSSRNIRSYKIFVNGRRTPQMVSDPSKVISITIPETASHNAASTRFTLNDARSSRFKGIVADDYNQIIYVNLEPSKKDPIAKEISQPSIDNRDRSRKKKKIIPVIACVAAIMAIALAICYFLGVFDSDNGQTAIGKDDKQAEKITSVNDNHDETDKNQSTGESLGDSGDFEDFAKSLPKEEEKADQKPDAEKIKADKETKVDKNDKTGPSPKNGTPEKKNPEQIDAQLLQTYNSAITQLTSAVFTYSDFEGYKALTSHTELGEDRLSKLNRAIALHESTILALDNDRCEIDDYKKFISDEIGKTKSSLPKLAQKLRELSSKNDEDLETYRLDFINRHKRKGQQKVY